MFKEKSLMLIQGAFAHVFYLFLRRKIKREKENNSKIVVGFNNLYYNGNPRAVFEYMRQFPDKYDCFWFVNNWKNFKDGKKRGVRVYYKNGIMGMPQFLRTDVWVVAHTAIRDIPSIPHNKYKIIQLWHGVGPKGVNRAIKDYEKYDAWCVSSEFIKRRHIELWNAPPEKLYVTGFMEMDMLYIYLRMDRKDMLIDIDIKNDRKIILYAPTFDVGLWPWKNAHEEFEKLCQFCKENNAVLILRLHPYAKIERRKLEKIVSAYGNVYWLDMPKEPDTMKLLAIADILITDWSSLYTNYFLANRPIIYLDVNKEYFTKIRGKPEVPPQYRAGEIVHSNEEFYKALNIILKEGNRFKEKQKNLLKIIHGNIDGKASERVVKVIEKLI